MKRLNNLSSFPLSEQRVRELESEKHPRISILRSGSWLDPMAAHSPALGTCKGNHAHDGGSDHL